jgi:hypothetical protein
LPLFFSFYWTSFPFTIIFSHLPYIYISFSLPGLGLSFSPCAKNCSQLPLFLQVLFSFLWTWLSFLLLNLFPLCHLSFFLFLYFFFFLPRLGSLSPCAVIFTLLPLLLQVFFLSPWRIPFCHCMLPFSITLSLLLLLFPLYWTFLLYVVALSPSTIIFSPLPLFFFYAIDFSLSMPFPLLPSLFPLCHHSLPLGSFSPLCHHSLPLDFFFLMCRHFFPFTIVLFLFLWLFPLCHHSFPFTITPSP